MEKNCMCKIYFYNLLYVYYLLLLSVKYILTKTTTNYIHLVFVFEQKIQCPLKSTQ